MSTEIVKSDAQDIALSDGASVLHIIAKAAADPNVDVAKMQALLQMQEHIMVKQAEIAFTEAMNRLKPKLPKITKNGAIELKGGAKIRFAKYDDIHVALMPLLTEEGFTISYDSDLAGNGALLRVTVIVKHVQGHTDRGSVFLPLADESGAKNRVQGFGSTQSYGKRYALCNYFDIVAEGEDDGGEGGGTEQISQEQVNRIRDMMLHTSADEKRFLQYMKTDAVENIMVRDYEKAMAALNQKARKG